MKIFIDWEKAFNKVPHSFIITTLNIFIIGRTYLKILKALYENLTVKNIRDKEKLKVFPIWSGTTWRFRCSPLGFNTFWKFRQGQLSNRNN
jgi:hypothetical protein